MYLFSNWRVLLTLKEVLDRKWIKQSIWWIKLILPTWTRERGKTNVDQNLIIFTLPRSVGIYKTKTKCVTTKFCPCLYFIFLQSPEVFGRRTKRSAIQFIIYCFIAVALGGSLWHPSGLNSCELCFLLFINILDKAECAGQFFSNIQKGKKYLLSNVS